jgi:hypothetical protein
MITRRDPLSDTVCHRQTPSVGGLAEDSCRRFRSPRPRAGREDFPTAAGGSCFLGAGRGGCHRGSGRQHLRLSHPGPAAAGLRHRVGRPRSHAEAGVHTARTLPISVPRRPAHLSCTRPDPRGDDARVVAGRRSGLRSGQPSCHGPHVGPALQDPGRNAGAPGPWRRCGEPEHRPGGYPRQGDWGVLRQRLLRDPLRGRRPARRLGRPRCDPPRPLGDRGAYYRPVEAVRTCGCAAYRQRRAAHYALSAQADRPHGRGGGPAV